MSSFRLKERGPKEGECGLLDTKNVTGSKPKKLWIVRIPNDVSDAIEAISAGSNMGTLSMEGVGKDCVRSISLKPFHPSLPPTNYELTPVNKVQSESINARNGKLYGFSVSKDKTNVRLEGTVSSQFVLKPRRGNLYDEYVKKRNHLESMGKVAKRAKTMDEEEEEQTAQLPSTFIPTSIYRNAKEAAEQSLGEKKKKSRGNTGEFTTEELKEDLFKLFEKHEKIWMQDLKSQLPCSDSQLRSILSDVCEKEKVGAKVYLKLNADYRK